MCFCHSTGIPLENLLLLRAIIQEKYSIQLMVAQLAGMTKCLYCSNEYAVGIHDGTLLDNVIFTLEELAPNGNIQSVCYRGAWLVTDNSYLAWSTRRFRHRHCWWICHHRTLWSKWHCNHHWWLSHSSPLLVYQSLENSLMQLTLQPSPFIMFHCHTPHSSSLLFVRLHKIPWSM